MRRGGRGRAPDPYHAGTRRSREIARRAAARPAASSPRVGEMNTRTRWSGVKITSVWAITSQASPAAARHEDHLRQAGTREPRLAPPAARPRNHQLICSLMPHAGNHRHKAGQRRRLVASFASALARHINLFRAQRASPAPGGCRRAGKAYIARAGAGGPLSQQRLSTVGRRAATYRLLTVSAPPVLL